VQARAVGGDEPAESDTAGDLPDPELLESALRRGRRCEDKECDDRNCSHGERELLPGMGGVISVEESCHPLARYRAEQSRTTGALSWKDFQGGDRVTLDL